MLSVRLIYAFSAAVVTAAAVASAGMAFSVMVMVVTAHIGVIDKSALDECRRGLVRVAGYSAVKLDSGLVKCRLCAAADTSANQYCT